MKKISVIILILTAINLSAQVSSIDSMPTAKPSATDTAILVKPSPAAKTEKMPVAVPDNIPSQPVQSAPGTNKSKKNLKKD